MPTRGAPDRFQDLRDQFNKYKFVFLRLLISDFFSLGMNKCRRKRNIENYFFSKEFRIGLLSEFMFYIYFDPKCTLTLNNNGNYLDRMTCSGECREEGPLFGPDKRWRGLHLKSE